MTFFALTVRVEMSVYLLTYLFTIVDMIKQGNRKCVQARHKEDEGQAVGEYTGAIIAMVGHLMEDQQEDGPVTSHSGVNR